VPSRPLTPESRLVFRSADYRATAAELSETALEVRDWDRVMLLAESQVATAAVARMLHLTSVPIPTPVREYLAKSAMVSDFRMRHLATRAQETVAALAAAKVPVLLLKGAAAGAMRDPTFRDRPMTDLDLLVAPADVGRARDVIIAAGWPETTDPVLLELLKDQHHLPHFVDPRMPGIRLELHVRLLPDDHSFAFDGETMWRASRPAPAPFAGARVPSPELLVLHACIHFAWQHLMQFGAWRTLRLISGALIDETFDWDGFVATARVARAGTCCYWTLRLGERLGALSVPAAVVAALAPPNPRSVNDGLERHFVALNAPGESAPVPSQQLARVLWRAALRPRWSGHRSPGRLDPDQRWARALGTISGESRFQRYARHLASRREWWNFLSRTLMR
jgi:hypothetical protein